MILVNEIVHSMKRKKGTNGIVRIKIDMQKACDRVDLKVLSHIILSFDFLIKVVNLISQCSSADSLAILPNGSIYGNVKAERGLR